jgi:hypothetical protein
MNDHDDGGTTKEGLLAHTRPIPPIRPIPSFSTIVEKSAIAAPGEDDVLAFSRKDLTEIVRAFLAVLPFDRDLYRAHYPGFRQLEATGRISDLRTHWMQHGYFEGRLVYGWESLPFDIARELLGAPDSYFDLLRDALLAECFEDHEEAEKGCHAAISNHTFSLGAHVALAQLYFKTRRLVECDNILQKALAIDPNCKTAIQLLVHISAGFKQSERAVALAEKSGLGLDTIHHVLRVLAIGKIAAARRLAKIVLGDWINLAATRDIIDNRWAEVRAELKGYLTARKTRSLRVTEEIRLSYRLAQFGWCALACRIVRRLFESEDDATEFHGVPPETKVLALETLRIRDGAQSALDRMKSEGSFAESLNAVILAYRIRLAYDANNLEEVIAAGALYSSLHEDTKSLELVAWAMVRTGRVEEALSICRQHWAIPCSYQWIPEIVLSARLYQGAYTGLSFPRNIAHRNLSPIPRVVMQFWDQNVPPDDVLEATNTWAVNNPEFSHVRFSNESAREFILNYYGSELVLLFDYCHHAAMKSDFFRLAYLTRCGGIYVDADEVSREPLDHLFAAHPDKELFLCLAPDAFFVSNGFIACTPAHPIIGRTFHNAASAIRSAMAQNIKPDIWRTTGPEQLTLAIAEAMVEPELSTAAKSTGFLYWHTRARFSEIRELNYKRTVDGNWRARPWERSDRPGC